MLIWTLYILLFLIIFAKTEKSGYFWLHWINSFKIRILCVSWTGQRGNHLSNNFILQTSTKKCCIHDIMKNASKPNYFCVRAAHYSSSFRGPFSVSNLSSHCLDKYTCTCQVQRPDVGSENMVTVIMVLPGVSKWEPTHNPFIMQLEDLFLTKWEWRNFKGNLSNSFPVYNFLKGILPMRKKYVFKGDSLKILIDQSEA